MTTRRDFLKGTAGLATLALVPKWLVGPASRMLDHPAIPILYGDGEHDDAPALQALVDGKPVDASRDKAATVHPDGSFVLASGTYLIRRTVRIPKGGPRGLITHSWIKSDEEFEDEALICVAAEDVDL